MDLFSPINIGNCTLDNRIVMAPLTRCRSVEDHIPNDLMATYYEQRTSAGLIISEATQISPMGIGYPCTPGIYTPEQIEGWKKVTERVHKHGGKMFLQLWHVGRISHSSFLEGRVPVSASAIKASGQVYTFEGMKEYETPHALEIPEIQAIVKEYAQAAKSAIEAGFDGVEIHSANGYLLDQFLRDGTNRREDEYGGSIENRSRFLFEVIKAVISQVGADKTGLRLSPSGTFNDMSDSDPQEHFRYVCEKLNAFDLAYLHIVDALEGDISHGAKVVPLSVIRDAYQGVLIVCGGYDKEKGNRVIQERLADAVAYGTLYIANPDLPERFKTSASLNEADVNTFYTQDAKGYTDYPRL